MTPEQINRKMAEKVMGWHLPTDPELPIAWLDADDHWVGFWAEQAPMVQYDGEYEPTISKVWLLTGVDVFDPYHRWDHAAMGLEKFEEWEIGKTATSVYAVVWYRNKENKLMQGDARADTALVAICLACLEAVKEKE